MCIRDRISALSGLVGPVIGGLVFGLFGIEPVVMVSGSALAVSAALMVVVVRIPVSYTHLDVYKRQEVRRQCRVPECQWRTRR